MYARAVRRVVFLCLLLGSVSFAESPSTGTVTLLPEKAPPSAVLARLRELPRGVRAAVLVRDAQNGKVLESLNADQTFIPASTLKNITGAAVLVSRQGTRGWWSTELTVPAAQSGDANVKALTLRGTADPTLSVSDGPNSLRELARQAYAHGVRTVGELRLDESRLDGESFKKTVYELPMPAVRLREWENNPPNTVQQARQRLGAALSAELRRAGIVVASPEMTVAPVYTPYQAPTLLDKEGKALPPDPVIPVTRRPEQGVASVRSGAVASFVDSTLRPSDNGRAETLLATLAVKPGGAGTLAGAVAREKEILAGLGVEIGGLKITDGSGLGRDNALSARTLSDLLKIMYDLPYPTGQAALPAQLYSAHQNAFVEALPLAGTGENRPSHGGRGGTMSLRLVGSGLDVRAKTGTLPGVSSLAGYMTAKSGRTLTFVILMNGPETTPLLTLRAIQNRMVREMAAVH